MKICFIIYSLDLIEIQMTIIKRYVKRKKEKSKKKKLI